MLKHGVYKDSLLTLCNQPVANLDKEEITICVYLTDCEDCIKKNIRDSIKLIESDWSNE